MFSSNFIIFVFLISTSCYSVNYALETEGIAGGYFPEDLDLSYHVAVLGKLNGTELPNFVCSAAIIDDDLILGAAQCFLEDNGELKKLRFSISAAILSLRHNNGINIDILEIYTIEYVGHPYYINDLAVARLATSLNLDENPELSKVKVVERFMHFMNRKGVISGYGHDWVEPPAENALDQGYKGGSDFFLKYTNVSVRHAEHCSHQFNYINDSKQFCGTTKISRYNDLTGLCKNDAGSPLVIQNVVVGIGSRINNNCDDTTHGAVYTNTATYYSFIESIRLKKYQKNVQIVRNRPHVKPPPTILTKKLQSLAIL